MTTFNLVKLNLPPYDDLILPALKAVRRNPEFSGLRTRFMVILAQSKIFTLQNFGRTMAVPIDINGTTQTCAACFSSPRHALVAWAKLLQTEGIMDDLTPVIAEENSRKVFLEAVENGLHVYLNYQAAPEESYIFNAEETADFYLAAPWPLEPDQVFYFDNLEAGAGGPPPNAPTGNLH